MTFKQKIYHQIYSALDDKILSLKNVLYELGEGTKNETKSSAGDKHETARAMVQIEQENTGLQLQKALEQKAALEKIDISVHSSQVIRGSLLKTNMGYLFLSIAFGKLTVEGMSVIALSPQSPLGMKLIGLNAGDCTEVNGVRYCIESIE